MTYGLHNILKDIGTVGKRKASRQFFACISRVRRRHDRAHACMQCCLWRLMTSKANEKCEAFRICLYTNRRLQAAFCKVNVGLLQCTRKIEMISYEKEKQ